VQTFKEWWLTGFMAIILAIGLGKFLIVGPLSSTEMNIGAAATVVMLWKGVFWLKRRAIDKLD
jgi:hypothetical protein